MDARVGRIGADAIDLRDTGLAQTRQRLERLIEIRNDRPLSEAERTEYVELAYREQRLLKAQREAASASSHENRA
jgi:hypothetical protein